MFLPRGFPADEFSGMEMAAVAGDVGAGSDDAPYARMFY
jgi:hypothetical protein